MGKRNFISGLVSLIFSLALTGQNTLTGYEWWFDDDIETAVHTSIAPSFVFEMNETFPVNGLESGLHSFHIRFFDDSLRSSPLISRFFFIAPNQDLISSEIVLCEWWLDDQTDNLQILNFNPETGIQWMEEITLNDLEDGLHSFNFRFKDNAGLWSPTESRFFFKHSPDPQSDKQIVTCQHWIDDETTTSTTVNVTAGQQIFWTTALDFSQLTEGLHTMHLRFKDNSGMWSVPVCRFFYKHTPEPLTDKQIVSCQYWLDDDPEGATTEVFSSGQLLSWTADLDFSQLSAGLHTLNLRFKDNTGQWSAPLNRFFIKPVQTITSEPQIVVFRYWIDNDFEAAEEVVVNAPGVLVDITEMIDLTHIWKGEHMLHIQTRDDQGLWSVIVSDTITKQSLPVAAFDFIYTVLCDSTVVEMENLSIDGDVYSWDFGDGTTSMEPEPYHTYFETGNYTITLTVTDTITLQDSTVAQNIEINSGTSYGSLNPVVCDSFLSPSGNYSWNVSGLYYDTLVNSLGCDSILTIDLTILNSSTSSLIISSCDGYTSPSGLQTWTSSGVYYDTLVNAAGCDSVITIDLTIFETTYATLDEMTCDFYVAPSGSYTWDETGTYFDTIPNSAGCDSILTINLTVVEVDTSVTNMDPVLMANAENAEYQWIDCSTMVPIPGAIGQSFTATMNGTFAVIVTQDGCTDTSSCYTILSVEIGKNPFENGIHVFPNPTGGSVTLELGKELKEVMIFVRNKEGKLVVSKLFYNISETQLYIPGPPGQYTVEILSKEGEKAVMKVIRN